MSAFRWPWGERARVAADGTFEPLPADAPVEYWVCCRLDEPWTWRVMTNQHLGSCVDCGARIVFRISAKSPIDPAVQKICRRCAERRATSEGEC